MSLGNTVEASKGRGGEKDEKQREPGLPELQPVVTLLLLHVCGHLACMYVYV